MARNVVAIDFETSGYNPDSACALGMVRIRDGKLCGEMYRLIRPPSSRVCFTWVHGLTWKDLKDQPVFSDLWPDFSAFLQGADLLVAHNAPFDRKVLYACCQKIGAEPPSAPFACTLKGSRRTFGLPHNGLDDVCGHLGIGLEHHQALSDARGAALIYLELLKRGLPDEKMLLGPCLF